MAGKTGGNIEALKKENPNLQTYLRGPGDKIPDWGVLEKSIYGVDVARQMMRIAVMNLVLHDVAGAKIKRGNPLSEISGLTDEDVHRKYKVILSNPPFAGKLPKESIRSDLPSNARKSELLFLFSCGNHWRRRLRGGGPMVYFRVIWPPR